MRFLFTTQPGHGHFFPLISLAQGLEQAGHEVKIACSESFVPRVARAGLQAVAAGLDWLESAPEHVIPEAAEMSPSEVEVLLVEIFVGTSAQHMAVDLLELCEHWRPDLIVRDAYEFGGCVVGEALKIAHIPVDMELYIPPHVQQDGMKNELAYLRSAVGLPPHPAMEMLTRHGYISIIPPSYQVPEYRLPEQTITLRPTFPQGSIEELPDWFHHLPQRKTVYATMGTTFNKVPDIIRLIIEGLRTEDINLIITVGPGQDPRQFDPVPDHIHIEQFIPQAALMPHCDLVIANGGIGTTMIALASGLPLVLIPLSGHLTLHAQRCRDLDFALSLKLPEGLYRADAAAEMPETFVARQAQAMLYDESPTLSPESLQRVVRQILHEPRYRLAAQKVQAEMASLPAPEYAVQVLEQLAKRGADHTEQDTKVPIH